MRIITALMLILLLAGCEQAFDVEMPESESADAVSETLRLEEVAGNQSAMQSSSDDGRSAAIPGDGGQVFFTGGNDGLVTLGRVLFYERELSRDRTVSCASCHRQDQGFSDSNQFSRGIGGAMTTRQAMSVANVVTYPNGRMFWDERAESLEEQALMPIENPDEMGLDIGEAVVRVDALPYYDVLFQDAFGNDLVTPDRIAEALSAFQRSIVTTNSRWDAWLAAGGFPGNGNGNGNGGNGNGGPGGVNAGGPPAGGVVVTGAGGPPPPGGRGGGNGRGGQQGGGPGGAGLPGNGGPQGGGLQGGGNGGPQGGAGGIGNPGGNDARGVLTPLEERGRRLFFSGRTRCGTCHSGPDLVGDRPRNNGLDAVTTDPGAGRGRFKMASLRNIELTAPYMHDGRFATLREVVEHYDSGVQSHPALDNRLRNNQGQPRRLNLSEQDKEALVAFLRTLTDESLATDERFSNPFIN